MPAREGIAIVPLDRDIFVLAVADTGGASIDSQALDSVSLVEAGSTAAVEIEAAIGGHEALSRQVVLIAEAKEQSALCFAVDVAAIVETLAVRIR